MNTIKTKDDLSNLPDDVINTEEPVFLLESTTQEDDIQ